MLAGLADPCPDGQSDAFGARKEFHPLCYRRNGNRAQAVVPVWYADISSVEKAKKGYLVVDERRSRAPGHKTASEVILYGGGAEYWYPGVKAYEGFSNCTIADLRKHVEIAEAAFAAARVHDGSFDPSEWLEQAVDLTDYGRRIC